MPGEHFEQSRFFLKDSIRQQIDFSQTPQHRGEPAPPLQKPCPEDTPRIMLPDGEQTLRRLGDLSIAEAVLRRTSVRRYSSAPLTLDELAALLYATQGVRHIVNPACALRTVPSAGARHAFETYIAAQRVDALSPGLYRYLPFEGSLAQLNLDHHIAQKAARACLEQGFVARAAAVFFWTTLPARMEWRYDLAAHKVIAIDAGHVCQNLYLAAEALGSGVCAIAAYNQDACDALLDVDGAREFTIYIAALGKK